VRALSVASWTVVVAGAALGLLLSGSARGGTIQATLVAVLGLLFAIALAQLLLAATTASRSRRTALLALTAGVALWSAGSAVLNSAEVLGPQQFPTPGEALFLASYVGFAAFLVSSAIPLA